MMRITVGNIVLAGALALAVIGPPTNAQPAGAAAAPRGKEIYESRCAECHGLAGKGDGPAAHLMTPGQQSHWMQPGGSM